MRSHTPEIFAARGIVALQPPPAPAIAAVDDIRTQALAYSLSDLITRKCHEGDPETLFYNDIESIRQEFQTDIRAALDVLEKYHDKSLAFLARRDAENGDWVQELQIELGQFASQGVYLLDEQGIVREYATPNVLPKALRKLEMHQKTLRERPYFRQAKSFREAFVSDCAESKFNKHSTVFFCKPITAGEFMKGLLFSACQIGQWSKPIDIAERYWAKEISFLLIDSNGVCLLPPNNEFPPKDRQETKNGVSTAPGANIGYEYAKLLSLSLRDSLISHIGSSVVPVSRCKSLFS